VTSEANSSGTLLNNLLLFGRLLRRLGLDVNLGRMINLVQALDYIQIGRKADFYHAIRCLLIHNKEDLPLFDQAFELFWRKPAEEWTELDLSTLGPKKPPKRPVVMPPPLHAESPPPIEDDQEAEEAEQTILEVTRTYSARELLRRKDFGDLSHDELDEIKEMMAQLIWQLGERRTRR